MNNWSKLNSSIEVLERETKYFQELIERVWKYTNQIYSKLPYKQVFGLYHLNWEILAPKWFNLVWIRVAFN